MIEAAQQAPAAAAAASAAAAACLVALQHGALLAVDLPVACVLVGATVFRLSRLLYCCVVRMPAAPWQGTEHCSSLLRLLGEVEQHCYWSAHSNLAAAAQRLLGACCAAGEGCLWRVVKC